MKTKSKKQFVAQTDRLQHFDELLTGHELLITVSNRRRTAATNKRSARELLPGENVAR